MAIGTMVLADGFVFTEGPRWHEGRLWCSDMHGHRVVAIDPDGTVETMAIIDEDEPSGLGWLPDGRLLIVSMERQWLLRRELDGSIVCHADLTGLARGSLNDMIVANDGTAYIGDMGSHIHAGGEMVAGQTLVVHPDSRFAVAADDLKSPNGHVLSADERTLLVAESGGMCITAFDRAKDGTLSSRRNYASLAPSDPEIRFAPPDGICLDSEDAVWVADPIGARVFRVRPGGAVTDIISFAGEVPVACVLGGADRCMLYICVAADWRRDQLAGTHTGRIAQIPVTVAGIGKP